MIYYTVGWFIFVITRYSVDNKVVNIEDDEDDYISYVYWNSNIIYTWKDGTKYYYDADFLNMLKNEAKKKWESDLVKYL